MLYLDLAEIPQVVDAGMLSTSKYGLGSFLRADHLYAPERSLTEEVRQIVRDQTQQESRGPIRLLTQLRICGYFMSPLNLFYCYDESDQELDFIVAEVNNTPWNERHCYVLWSGNQAGSDTERLRYAHSKEFHVSPYMGMDMQYNWDLSVPNDTVTVGLTNRQQGNTLFEAHMNMARRELSKQNLRRMTCRYPLMTSQIVAAIYWQALKLWWKKCPFYAHPQKQKKNSSSYLPQVERYPGEQV